MRSYSLNPSPSGPALTSRWPLRTLLLLGLLLVVFSPAYAQSGPTPAATMTTVKNIAFVVLQAIMAIGLIIGLTKVAKNFLSGSPESITSFLWLMGGVIIFFGWGYFFRAHLAPISHSGPTIGSIGNANLNEAVSAGAYAMAQRVLDTMITTVVPLLLFTTIALTVVRGFISSGSVQFELGPIFRVFFLYTVLISYNLLIPQVGNLIGGLAQLVNNDAHSTSAYTVLAQMKAASDKQTTGQPPSNPGQAGNETKDGTGLLNSLGTTIGNAFTNLQTAFSPQNFIMGLATSFMTSMIQSIMEFIQSFLLAFLYVSGPIAISFSLLPGFGGVAKSWLQSLIGIHMWSIAFQVITGIFHYYSAYQAAQASTSAYNLLANSTGIAQTQYAVACIVFIIMYIMVPYMTSLIVGSSAADSFVSSAVRIGSSLASGGAAAGGAALGVAGAGAKAVNAVGGGASFGAKAGTFARGAGSAIQNSMGGAPGGNLSSIGQMLSNSAPQMAAAGTNSANGSDVRTSSASGEVPSSIGSASGSSQSGSSQSVDAQNVASMAGVTGGSTSSAQPPASSGVPSMASASVAAAGSGPANTGGSAGGFGGVTATRVRPMVGPTIGSPPPMLNNNGRA